MSFTLTLTEVSTQLIMVYHRGMLNGEPAKALAANGFETTIVDTRQALFDASQMFFDVPDSVNFIVSDPQKWLRDATPADRFDVVIHDLFNGGELPARFYTTEFWASTKAVMSDGAIIGVVSIVSSINPINLRQRFSKCFTVAC